MNPAAVDIYATPIVGRLSAVAATDVLTVVGFGAAFVLVLLIPLRRESAHVRSSRLFLAVAMLLYLFVGVSNTLQWLDVTDLLDPFEDYAKILFVPTMAYILYSLSSGQQINDARVAEARTRAEHHLLESIVDTTPAGIMVVYPDGHVSFANDRARDLLMLEQSGAPGIYELPADMTMGSEPARRSDAAASLMELLERGNVSDVVRFVARPDMDPIAVQISAKRLDEDRESGSVVAFADITDRMRYRDDLERAVDVRTRELLEVNERLREANSAKRDFLARMSHELRTPLNSIIGFTGVMLAGQAGAVTEEQRVQLGMVKNSGEQLLTLVNDILDVSVMEAGRLQASFAPVELRGLFETVVEGMSPMANDHGVELKLMCDAGTIVTDAEKLAQIVRNLLSNAVKFTDPGGSATLDVRMRAADVTIAVSDTGMGIPPEHLAAVFEPFHQVDVQGRAKDEGRGLGLAICRDLSRLLGGDIVVQSEPGHGATFIVTLPLEPKAP